MTALSIYEPKRATFLHYLVYACLYALSYLLISFKSHHAYLQPDLSITSGFLVAMLLLHRYKDWLYFLGIFLVLHNGLEVLIGTFDMVFYTHSVVLFIAVALGVIFIRKTNVVVPDFTNWSEMVRFFLFCIFVVATLSSLLGTIVIALHLPLEGSFFWNWFLWWTADSAGIMVITPLFLITRHILANQENKIIFARLPETIITLIVVLIIWFDMFITNYSWFFEQKYLAVAALFWVSIRFSVRRLAFFSAVMATIAVLSHSPTSHIWHSMSIQDTHLAINTFITISLFLTYSTSAILAERRHSSTLAKLKEEEYYNLYMNSPIGVCKTALHGNIEVVNPALCRLLGYEEAELLGKEIFDWTHPNDVATIKLNYEELKKGQVQEFTVELNCYRKDKNTIWLQVTGNLLQDERLNASGVNLHITDITQQKNFQDQLILSERKFREIYEHTPLGTLRLFPNGQIESANPGALAMLEITAFEAVGKHLKDFVHPDNMDYFLSVFKNVMAGNVERIEIENCLRSKKNRTFYTKTYFTQIRNPDNSPAFILVKLIDITDLKHALEEICRSDERFRRVFEEGPLMSAIIDVESNTYLAVNNRLCEISEYTEEELLNKKTTDVSWVSREQRLAMLNVLYENGSMTNAEFTFTAKSGRKVYVHFSAVLMDMDGHPRILALAEDVTEFKLQEQKRQEAEAQYQQLFQSVHQGIVVVNQQGEVVDCNPAAEMVLGLTREQLLERGPYAEDWKSVYESGEPFPSDQHPSVLVLNTGKSIFGEVMGILKPSKQEMKWIKIDAIPEFRVGEKEPFRAVVIISDWTYEKRAQEYQRLSQQRLEGLFRLTKKVYISEDAFLQEMLNELISLSESEEITLFSYNPSTRSYELMVRSQTHQQWGLDIEPSQYPLQNTRPGSIFRKAIDTKRPVIINEFSMHPELTEMIPEGHFPVHRIMVVPLVYDKHVSALIAVANKKLPYTDMDGEQMEMFLSAIWTITEQRRSNRALLESISTNATIVEQMPSGFMLFEWDQMNKLTLINANQKTIEYTGMGREHDYGVAFEDLWTEAKERGLLDEMLQVMRTGDPLLLPELFYQDDHLGGYYRFVAFQLPNHRLAVVFDDITQQKRIEIEKRRLEDTLHQSLKMEAIGQLAGGIAHDINNLMQVIIGCAEMGQIKSNQGEPVVEEWSQIHLATDRVTKLVHQLLTFSRRGEIHQENIQLDEVVRSTVSMLKRLLGEQITLSMDIHQPIPATLADREQVEVGLINLCVNARDAMPNGGNLSIQVDAVRPNETLLRQYPWAPVGMYIRIGVSDTGTGIPQEIMHRIFEPFFSTKSRGKGSGLGLATLYGIVRKHNGFVTVSSKVGEGTVFEVYFPIVDDPKAASPVKVVTLKQPMTDIGKKRTILVAEDDTEVRQVIQRILEHAGFQVMIAVDGESAMQIIRDHVNEIQGYIIDGIMPKANGVEVFQFLRKRNPKAKVIFYTGYDFGTLELDQSVQGNALILQKPVSTNTLISALQEMLRE